MTSPANSLPLRASRVVPSPRAVTRTSSVQAGQTFRFGRCRLVVRERLLLMDDVPVTVGSRAFDLLVVLLEHAGETVDRQDLFARVWPDVIVAKVNLRVHIARLRKALGDGLDGNRFIVSVAGRGYRFVAPVDRVQSAVSVNLADVDDPAHVAMAVAAALGFEVEPQQALSCVLGYLRDKKMLLAFNNCEHVFAGVARLTERLCTEAPLVQSLIGSREALHSSPL